MAVANVLDALSNMPSGQYNNPTLYNISIYGRVKCMVEKPAFMSGINDDKGFYALVDAYALKCLNEDYFAVEGNFDYDRMYLTKGTILVFLGRTDLVGKDIRILGVSRNKGINIKQQHIKGETDTTTGISGLAFGRPEIIDGKKVFPLVPSVVYELNKSDIKNTILEDIDLSSDSIIYPNVLDDIVAYSGLNKYTILKVEEVKEDNYDSSNDIVDVSNIDMKLEYHLKGQDMPDYFNAFKEDVVEKSNDRKAFVGETLKTILDGLKDTDDSYVNILRDNFIGVASNPNRVLGSSSVKVKNFLMNFIDNMSELTLYKAESKSSPDANTHTMIKSGIERLKTLVITNPEYLYRGNTGFEEVDKVLSLNRGNSFIVNIIATITGISYSNLSNSIVYICNNYGCGYDDTISMLIHIPYVLGLFGSGINVADCDVINYSIAKKFDHDVPDSIKDLSNSLRKVMLMLDTLKDCSSSDTFVKISDYKVTECSYPKVAKRYINDYGFMAKREIVNLISMVLEMPLSVDRNVIPTRWFDSEIFEMIQTIGVVNTLEDTYIGLEYNIEKEMIIYEVFQGMGKEETGLSDDDIEEAIQEFEEENGFELESLQKDAIKLCKHKSGVLSGCAGSGKTTTSDCMTKALNKLEGIRIVYCTPTGKACRRLAEVVHNPVKTLHSQFNVSIGGSSYFSNVYFSKRELASSTKTIYILDEMAMCNMDLLYHVARHMFKNDMCYFLGDIKQLPPIGRGCPFKYLMKILPCVELGVSKRSAEGSLINYNVSLLNFMSDRVCRELKYDDKTFINKNCSDADLVRVTQNTFKGFLDGSLTGTKYSEDDIQVISGYQSNSKISSVNKLNAPIQSILRANDRIAYYKEKQSGCEDVPFYINDRVIYVNRNSYDLCRYVYEDGVFKQVLSFGCVNGEMGKLLGVLRTDQVKFNLIDDDISNISYKDKEYENVSEEEFNSLVERFKNKMDNLRNDESFALSNYYFVVIQVYDADLSKDVYILLRGRYISSVDNDMCLGGSDLDNLNLAYALTCHKMQGSQNKVIISVLESGGSPIFLNRNLINTMITRSQEVVAMVGSVIGSDSMLTLGRKNVSRYPYKNLLSMFSGNDSWVG